MEVPAEVLEYASKQKFGKLAETAKLEGGLISLTRRLTFDTGATAVLKQCETPPAELYQLEADGLSFLDRDKCPRIPDRFLVGDRFLLLEDLGNGEPHGDYWQRFGRSVAHLHLNHCDRYGYSKDNYLGILLLDNAWSEDGYEFFARTRILRFLDEPKAVATLTKNDRKLVERLSEKLPDLIPYQPPSLIHGDLWAANMPCDSRGNPCLIDPAVYFGWPEADLSMAFGYDGVPTEFFDAYREINPLEKGWEDRLHLLNIREFLSMIAHTGDEYDTLSKLRELLARFA